LQGLVQRGDQLFLLCSVQGSSPIVARTPHPHGIRVADRLTTASPTVSRDGRDHSRPVPEVHTASGAVPTQDCTVCGLDLCLCRLSRLSRRPSPAGSACSLGQEEFPFLPERELPIPPPPSPILRTEKRRNSYSAAAATGVASPARSSLTPGPIVEL